MSSKCSAARCRPFVSVPIWQFHDYCASEALSSSQILIMQSFRSCLPAMLRIVLLLIVGFLSIIHREQERVIPVAAVPSCFFRLASDELLYLPWEAGEGFYNGGRAVVIRLELFLAGSERKIGSFRGIHVAGRHFFTNSLFHFFPFLPS